MNENITKFEKFLNEYNSICTERTLLDKLGFMYKSYDISKSKKHFVGFLLSHFLTTAEVVDVNEYKTATLIAYEFLDSYNHSSTFLNINLKLVEEKLNNLLKRLE